MIVVLYKLIDSCENEREFENMVSAKLWVKGISECMFDYVTIEMDDGTYLDGYQEIMNYGKA